MARYRILVFLVANLCCHSIAQVLEEQEVEVLEAIMNGINEIKTTLEEQQRRSTTLEESVTSLRGQFTEMQNKLSTIQDQMTTLQNCATVDHLENLRDSVATEQNETRNAIHQFSGRYEVTEVRDLPLDGEHLGSTSAVFGDCEANGTFLTSNETAASILNLHFCVDESLSVAVACEEGSEFFQGLCYYISSRKGTWKEGDNYCQEMSGSYAEISKPEEWAFVASRVKDNAWVGRMDIEKEGTFKWNADPTYVYTNFQAGQPDNYDDLEHCIHYSFDSDFRWNDWTCHKETRYLCERERNNEGCPADYIGFEGSCYLFSSEQKSWWDAKEACKDMGAYFAKITSEAEDSFIRGHLIGHTWFGLSDLDKEGRFKWTKDGETIYGSKEWHRVQPESVGDIVDCPHLWKDKDYLLNEHLCETQFNFVCTKEPSVRVV